jgi:CheY-like chemotaxis protein
VPSAVASLTDVVTASQRAADLCRQLLAYSGRGKFTIEEVDVSELAREMTQILELSVGRFAAVKLELTRPGPRAEVDPTQLRQVVMNLVLNAAEALEGGRGLITVVTSLRDLDAATRERTSNPDVPLGRYACIEVADTGRGIPAELLDRIFDPFFTTKAAGRGLGLAAVHGIVRSHSGTLRVDSEPGRGTSFKVYLPAKPSAHHVETVSLRRRGTVLVVDDDEMVRQTLHRQLTRAGFEVVLAANGEDAVLTAQARGRELTAFLIDVTMPGLTGPDVFLRLRSLLPTARVVLMSGYNHVDIVRRYTTEGLAGFVQKPFTIQEVMRLLEG